MVIPPPPIPKGVPRAGLGADKITEYDRLDCENGRYWIEASSPGFDGARVVGTEICDGQRAMQRNESKRDAKIWPVRHTEALERARRLPEGLDWLTGVDRRGVPAVYQGRQTVDGVACMVWKKPLPSSNGFKTEEVTAWVRATDGRPMRVRRTDMGGAIQYDVIACNEPIDEKLFRIEAPEGYTVEQVGPDWRWQLMSRKRVLEEPLVVDAKYLLPDRSLVVAVRTGKESPAWPQDMVERQRFGQKVSGLSPWIEPVTVGDSRLWLQGRHLAVTKHGGTTYEWAVFVPVTPLPPSFDVLYWIHKGKSDQNLSHMYQVRTPREFEEMIRGNVAEFSDDGKAPAEVTFEAVEEMTEKAGGRKWPAPPEGAATQPTSGASTQASPQ